MRTTIAFATPIKYGICWSGLSLHLIEVLNLGVCHKVSTPSIPGYGLARDYHTTGFPEFDRIHLEISFEAALCKINFQASRYIADFGFRCRLFDSTKCISEP